jgi:hypothetical protein
VGDKNRVEQRIRLDGKEYILELKRVRSATRSELGAINKEVHSAGRAYQDYTNAVKKASSSLLSTLGDIGKAFAKNLGRGAMLGGAAAGVSFLNTQMRQTVSTSLDFGRAFAQLASRADLSQARIRKLREEFYKLGAAGANLDSLPGAVSELLGATGGNMDKAMSVMPSVAKTAAMGDGDAAKVAKYVTEILKGEGREVNASNVQSLLGSAVSGSRAGNFANADEFLAARLNGVSGVNGRSGMGDKQFAGLMAGASNAGLDKDSGLAAINALVRASVKELGGDQMLGGFLGVGSLRGKGGGFDSDKLTQAAANMKKRGMSDNQLVEVLQGVGLSEQESSGLVAILKNIQTFQTGVKKVASDQKSLDEAFSESTNNLSDKMQKLRNSIIAGFGKLAAPFEAPAGKALDAATELSKNPAALIAGGLLGTAAGGKLASKLLGSFGGVAGGVAKGKALEQAGVQPVYVVNASEFGGGGGVSIPPVGKMGMAGALGIGSAAVAAGLAAGQVAGAIVEPGGLGAAAKSVGADSLGETLDRMEKAFTDWSSKLVGMHSRVEIQSNDPAFRAIPKATDNARLPGGF